MPKPSPAPAARRGRRPKPRDLELRITIAGIEPAIWRLVRVPDEYTLHQLNKILQFLFGWEDYHLYEFRIGERRFEAPDPEAEGGDSTAVTLRDLALSPGARFKYVYDPGDEWVHEILIEDMYIVTRDPDEPVLPVLYNGERAGPGEDSGGPGAWMESLAALRDPSHPEHQPSLTGVDRVYDPDRFDPWLAARNLSLAALWGAI